ncbi:thioredoxin domain-containing protein [Acidovorax sp. SUPP3334]|nr:thioredoxin domain-containing protein [Acidovorax sp. SUPP3334]
MTLYIGLHRSGSSERPIAGDARREAPMETSGTPWVHGPLEARFALTLYADLECPFCKTYYPALKDWIDRHPDTRLQWHHLPLPTHEPAASNLAALAECVGQAKGNGAYWDAVAWIYRNTRGEGQGVEDRLRYPGTTPDVQNCLDSGRGRAAVQAQAAAGAREGVVATPTVRVTDTLSGQTLLLHGQVEGDALLSALDLIGSGNPVASDSRLLTDPAAHSE